MQNFKIFRLERVPGLGFLFYFFSKMYPILARFGASKMQNKKKEMVNEMGLYGFKTGFFSWEDAT